MDGRYSNSLLACGTVVLVLLLSGTTTVMGAVPVPTPTPDGPDHGVNTTTYARLWSGDDDTGSASADGALNATSEADFVAALANSTDFLFDRPPAAVDQWNDGEHASFDGDGRTVSIAPEGTTLRSRGPIRDAYVEVFAVTPSTVVHESGGTTWYVPSASTVRAISDYRLAVPADVTNGSRRVTYRLSDHEVGRFQLRAGTRILDEADAAHAVELTYQNLSGTRRLTVTRTLSASVAVQTSVCDDWRPAANETDPVENTTGGDDTIAGTPTSGPPRTSDGPTGDGTPSDVGTSASTTSHAANGSATDGADDTVGRCAGSWNTTESVETTTVRLSDSIDIAVYRLGRPTGVGARFSDGTAGAMVAVGQPWSTLRFGDGDPVRSPWRFFTARRPGWTQWAVSESEGTTAVAPSDAGIVPLQTHAIPTTSGYGVGPPADADRVPNLAVSGLWGPTHDGPELDPEYALPVAASYREATRVSVRSEKLPSSTFERVHVSGLVAGEHTIVRLDRSVAVHETRTTVRTTDVASDTVTVDVAVVDDHDAPVEYGRVLVGNQSFALANGSVTATIARPWHGLRVAYDPGFWWDASTTPAYLPSQERVYPVDLPSFQRVLSVATVTVLWLLPLGLLLYGYDRASNGALFGAWR